MADSERPRVRQFRQTLAGLIPCEPEEVRTDLEEMGLPELLGRYVNWADRYVPPRPRRVVTWHGFLRHGSPQPHLAAVDSLAKTIEAGGDIRPFLSDRIARCGYVRPKAPRKNKPSGVEWDDKDYALNAYETHHLHLRPRGSEELLFVSFSREDAFLVMVGNHKSFDDGTLAQAVAEARLGTLFEFKEVLGSVRPRPMSEQNSLQRRRGFSTVFQVGEQMVMGAMLTTAGTSPLHNMHVAHIMDCMTSVDPQLESAGFGRERFEQAGLTYPSTPSFDWVMRYCDLWLDETTTSTGFLMARWRR